MSHRRFGHVHPTAGDWLWAEISNTTCNTEEVNLAHPPSQYQCMQVTRGACIISSQSKVLLGWGLFVSQKTHRQRAAGHQHWAHHKRLLTLAWDSNPIYTDSFALLLLYLQQSGHTLHLPPQ